MTKNIKWIITAVMLVVIIAGASVLYNNLSKEYGNQNLTITSDDTSEKDNSPDTRPEKAPDITVTDYDGNKVKLSDFKGKPVVLNFWATWCYYCKEEMPDFNKAYENYPDIQFMMINATDGVRETFDIAKEYVKSENFGFDVFFDTEYSAVNAYRVTGFPSTFFIDKDGNLRSKGNGMLTYENLERGIQTIL